MSKLGAGLVLGMLAVTSKAEAQAPAPGGVHVELLGGVGYLSAKYSAEDSDVEYRGLTLPVGMLVGARIAAPLVVGAGVFGEVAPSGSVTGSGWGMSHTSTTVLGLFSVGAFADVRPAGEDGLRLQPFVGYGELRSANYDGEGGALGGPVLALGCGYDWRLGPDWRVGPMVRIGYAPLSVERAGFDTVMGSLLLGVSYR